MKEIVLFFIGLVVLVNCNSYSQKENSVYISDSMKKDYKEYGGSIVPSDYILNKNGITEKYKNLKVGDTITATFLSTVNSVCKAKGCWMRVALGTDDQESMIKFKDYGFFVPKDIENDTVIVFGKAFVNEVSVSEQRHYASDAGMTKDKIASITTPKKTYSFIADGVLIKSKKK
ncbi:DUF4920 domain-containing protein [Aquimarina longa]|uniref:DUF4920 domain-containing protein n=1 Tax=Aquimarina longa TaxID=1080221 RepID=UPI000780AFF3|nr:DUF4920 domain-containing protein [Aquimarina longa]